MTEILFVLLLLVLGLLYCLLTRRADPDLATNRRLAARVRAVQAIEEMERLKETNG